MSRYRVASQWRPDKRFGNFVVQRADATDTKTGATYQDGAMRVVDDRTGKPVKRGKGGTVPFYGEAAWMDAERLADDLATRERFDHV